MVLLPLDIGIEKVPEVALPVAMETFFVWPLLATTATATAAPVLTCGLPHLSTRVNRPFQVLLLPVSTPDVWLHVWVAWLRSALSVQLTVTAPAVFAGLVR